MIKKIISRAFVFFISKELGFNFLNKEDLNKKKNCFLEEISKTVLFF